MVPRPLSGAHLAARALVLPAVLILTAACGATPSTATQAPSATYATSVTALLQKAESIAADSCTIKPAVQVYPDCARYVAEVGNLALASQGVGTASASRLSDEVGRFSRTGCVAAPGVAGPPAESCGAVLTSIQTDLKQLKSELTAKAGPT